MNHKLKKRTKRFQRNSNVSLNLTDRDKEIIRWVYRHRFLSSAHINSILGGSHQGILRRLSMLYHTGYLDRPQRQKFVLGKNHCLVYGLGNRGAGLIASQYGIPVEAVDWSRKNRETKEIFLEHTLLISKILTVFRLACRKRNDIDFIEPEHLIKRRRKPPTIKTHALSWRVNINKGQYGQNRNRSFNMIPDSLFGLRVRSANKIKETYFFLEADRATMPIKRTNFIRSSFYKKMIGYMASHRNGLFSKYFDFKKVRILTVTKSDERIKNMIKVNKDLNNQDKSLNLFLFAIEELIHIDNPMKILKPVWIDSRGKKISLLQ